jgi:hypothetical protein
VRDGPRFDLDDLRRSATDDLAYGRLLTESLFAVPDVRQLFATARVAAESWELPLRMRLFIGPSAPELHDVRWETLRDPGNGASLLTNESVLFSRYLSSLDWRPAGVRPKAGLRALVVIANPSDLASYRPNGRELAPIPVDAELTMIRAALDPVGPTVLASSGSATLDGLVDALRDGYDVVVLMCHGYLVHREPQLLLETATGTAARVPGSALVERLRDLPRMPRLVVLASCQSAGAGEACQAAATTGRWPRWARAWPRSAFRRWSRCRAASRCARWTGSCRPSSGSCAATGRSTARWRSRGAPCVSVPTGGCPCCSCG